MAKDVWEITFVFKFMNSSSDFNLSHLANSLAIEFFFSVMKPFIECFLTSSVAIEKSKDILVLSLKIRLDFRGKFYFCVLTFCQ